MGKQKEIVKTQAGGYVRTLPSFLLRALRFLLFFACFFVALVSDNTFGQWGETPGLQEKFDSDQPSWEMLYVDSSGEFTDRARVSDMAVSGKSETYQCEFVDLGIYFVGHQILLPCLIEDLSAGVWVRSQESGIASAFEVVLPKSRDKDGKPVTLLLPGHQYTNRGEWQQLRVKADLRELERQAQMLRLELGVPIDTSEAYVRRLVLCCYVSSKSSRIWLDDLHAEGMVMTSRQIREECESDPVFNPKNVLWLFRKIDLYHDLTPGVQAHVEATAVPIKNWTLSQNTATRSMFSNGDEPGKSLIPEHVLAETRELQRKYGLQANNDFPATDKGVPFFGEGFQQPSDARSQWVPRQPIAIVSTNDSRDGTAFPITNAAGAIVPDHVTAAFAQAATFDPTTLDRHISSMPQGATFADTGDNVGINATNVGANGVDTNNVIYGPARTSILPPDSAIAPTSYVPNNLPGGAGMSGTGTPGSRAAPLSLMLSDQPDLFQPANAGEFPEHALQDRISRGKPHDGCRITAQQRKIMINGNLPFAVRAVEYRGEPLAFLAGLQFNTVWLRQPPTEQLLEEAWQLGLWVICQPPDRERVQPFVDYLNRYGMTDDGKTGGDGQALGIIGRMFARNRNPILAWDVGRNLTQGQFEQMSQYFQRVQAADSFRRIPLICSAESGTRDYSRIVDVILLDREPILASLEMTDYNTWLSNKVGWGRGGTPNWCTIQTQPSAEMAHQWRLFGVDDFPAAAVSEEHVRQQIRLAMANECHGLFFSSQSRLDATNAETKYRAALLELVNMELLLVEGWLTAGSQPQPVRSNVPGVDGVLLTTERAKLLLANVNKPFGQYVMGNTNCNNVDFLMPGSFETHQANHIIPGGTRPLTLQRVTGGVRIHFDEVNTSTTAFFAQAEPILRAILPRSRQADLSRRSSELAIELAKMRLEQVRKTIRAFQEIQASTNGLPNLSDGPIITMPEQESMLRETERAISTAESYYRQTDYSSAYQQAQRSMAGLQYYERLKWEEAIRNMSYYSHNMLPTSVSFVTLPAYIETIKKMTRMKPGENRLLAGDGENAAQWQQAGWQSLSSPTEGVTPIVSVGNAQAARSGQGGIQLMLLPTSQLGSNAPTIGGSIGVPTEPALSATEDETMIQLETAPVWVTSPPIPVYAGETLCITGYVNIPQKLQGNVDGLMIFDSLGGESLALRFTETDGQWRQFVCYRAVPNVVPPRASMRVTFALSALGEVRFDDLQIFPIVPDPDAQKTSTETQNSGSAWPQLPQLPRIDQMFRSE